MSRQRPLAFEKREPISFKDLRYMHIDDDRARQLLVADALRPYGPTPIRPAHNFVQALQELNDMIKTK